MRRRAARAATIRDVMKWNEPSLRASFFVHGSQKKAKRRIRHRPSPVDVLSVGFDETPDREVFGFVEEGDDEGRGPPTERRRASIAVRYWRTSLNSSTSIW